MRSLDAARADALLRAAQEMLTNARRHVPGRAADLVLETRGSRAELRCRVRAEDGVGRESADLIGEGPRPGSPGGGFGLLGMRERCEAVGGGASARLLADGTFETCAHVPLTVAGHAGSASTPSRQDPQEEDR
jgi:signal transduction histidine kinase